MSPRLVPRAVAATTPTPARTARRIAYSSTEAPVWLDSLRVRRMVRASSAAIGAADGSWGGFPVAAHSRTAPCPTRDMGRGDRLLRPHSCSARGGGLPRAAMRRASPPRPDCCAAYRRWPPRLPYGCRGVAGCLGPRYGGLLARGGPGFPAPRPTPGAAHGTAWAATLAARRPARTSRTAGNGEGAASRIRCFQRRRQWWSPCPRWR